MLLVTLLGCPLTEKPADEEPVEPGPMTFETADDVLLGWVAVMSNMAASSEFQWSEGAVCPAMSDDGVHVNYTTGCADDEGYAWTGAAEYVMHPELNGSYGTLDAYGFTSPSGASFSITGAHDGYVAGNSLEFHSDVRVEIDGLLERADQGFPTFARLGDASHTFDLIWDYAGDIHEGPFDATVRIDGLHDIEAEGVLAEREPCGSLVPDDIVLHGANTAEVYLEPSESCDCVIFEIDGVVVGESCPP